MMWPPSSWPNGSRFSAVASMPNQAANTIGCTLTVLAVGHRCRTSATRPHWKSSGSPRKSAVPLRRRGHDAARASSPRTAPAAARRSRRSGRRRRCRTASVRVGNGSRIRMTAPSVPVERERRQRDEVGQRRVDVVAPAAAGSARSRARRGSPSSGRCTRDRCRQRPRVERDRPPAELARRTTRNDAAASERRA